MISFSDVTHKRGNKSILRSVNFTLEETHTRLITGSGKSTVCRLIAGEITPDNGEVFVFDAPIHRLTSRSQSQIRSQMGIMFGHDLLMLSKTPLENVMLKLRLAGICQKESKFIGMRMLAEVGIDVDTDVKTKHLSTQVRTRVAWACALVLSPQLLVLDSPLLGMGEEGAQSLAQIIRDRESFGQTTLVATDNVWFHNWALLSRWEITALEEQRMIAAGSGEYPIVTSDHAGNLPAEVGDEPVFDLSDSIAELQFSESEELEIDFSMEEALVFDVPVDYEEFELSVVKEVA